MRCAFPPVPWLTAGTTMPVRMRVRYPAATPSFPARS